MSLPMPANVTCDIYHGGNTPPGPPDVAGAAAYLEEDFSNLKPHDESVVCLVAPARLEATVDVRDNYNGVSAGSALFVPNQTGTKFQVQAVARVGRGTALDHKIVYLLRSVVTWPSDDV